MEERENFGSRLGFILVSAGCAVGLGNVWKFPYICGENGGAIFIFIYLFFLLILGLPILICEFSVGRGSGLSLAGAFAKLGPKKSRWHHFKWYAFAGNYLLMMFYTMVAGWMFYYVYQMLAGKIHGQTKEQIENVFANMLHAPGTMAGWTIVAIVLAFLICSLGLKNGVERITKVMMLLLLVLMVALVVRSLTLDGAKKGLEFYLVPDWNRFKEHGMGNVIFAAMSHAFFTLSVGIGSMEIFGSYLKKNHKLTGEAASVVCLDTLIALMAGVIIIPACFAYGVEPDSGPSLLFITLPNVFNHMNGGRIWGTCFFIFMSFAALSTVIAVFENIIAMSRELWSVTRKKAIGWNLVGITILSMPAVLGYNVLSKFTPMGPGSTIMDLEDFLVSYNILPLGCLCFVLFCASKNGWGYENFINEVNQGIGWNFPKRIRWYMRYVLPSIIVVIYLKGYYDTFVQFGKGTLLLWMTIALLLLGIVLSFSINIRKKNIIE